MASPPGRVILTLEDYISARGISKNQLVFGAGLQRTQLQSYCRNKVTRVDLDVLARICTYLDCELSDIMRFVRGAAT